MSCLKKALEHHGPTAEVNAAISLDRQQDLAAPGSLLLPQLIPTSRDIWTFGSAAPVGTDHWAVSGCPDGATSGRALPVRSSRMVHIIGDLGITSSTHD
jgi:hypothetical protein